MPVGGSRMDWILLYKSILALMPIVRARANSGILQNLLFIIAPASSWPHIGWSSTPVIIPRSITEEVRLLIATRLPACITRSISSDSLIVYLSPGLCPNAMATLNAVGVESNGTFGVPSSGAPLARNRGTSPYTPTYTYAYFQSGSPQGPQDYYYGIANNTSARYTLLNTWGKADGSSPSYRVFTLWDIIGDHTGAANTAKGNPPCDTTKPVSADQSLRIHAHY